MAVHVHASVGGLVSLQQPYFVEVDDPRGVGLLLGRDDQHADVEFFHSTTRQERVRLPLQTVRRTYLPRQTRVYFRRSDDRWRMGRVRDFLLEDGGAVTYEVRAPNQDVSDIPESALRVRCFSNDGDPAEVLAFGAAETQRWADARWPARRALTNLRAAAQGLTGLVSASVELVPHQADAVRRILHDPLQRYLLADEVGLGKTIEAGAVVRQTLLDDPSATALVLAPETLTGQWTHELEERFGLSGLGADRTRVRPHSDLSDGLSPATILVVDEAHRLAGGDVLPAPLLRLSAVAEKLLLLSATPPIGHEATLLGLLKLLDRDRWGDEPLVDFRTHVAEAQTYGRLLLGLRADASPFVLKQRMSAARSTFPEDPIVQDLTARFLQSEDPETRAGVTDRLRDHIADTYRIHHRIIRARRSDLEGWEFQPRGPAPVREEEDDDPGLAGALAALEDWRTAALLAQEAKPEAAKRLQRRHVALLEAVTTGRDLPSEPTEFFAGEADLVRAMAESLGPDRVVRRAPLVAEIATRQLRFLRSAGASAPKLVVFCSEADMAAAVAECAGATADTAVFAAAGQADLAQAFEGHPGPALAVLSEAGEEGLNLHFADAILHADLPFAVGRLEQRIGRLDRFGRTKGPIRHIVLTPALDDDTLWTAWLQLLRTGFEIFDKPTSDIQFALAAIDAEIEERLLQGPEALAEFEPGLRAQLSAQRTALDEQYALDQLAMSRDSARSLVESIEAAEVDESALGRDVDGLVRGMLQLKVRALDADAFTLAWAPDTQLPDPPWGRRFAPALQVPLTWKRRVAVARKDVRLIRPGSALTEPLQQLLDWDDRGSAFATWRFEPGGGGWGEERLAFRLCWVVGPGRIDAARLEGGESVEALERFAQSLMPTWTLTQHIGPDLETIDDPAWLKILERPFAPEALEEGGRDFNLGSRPDWLARVLQPKAFASLCFAARDVALARLVASPDYEAWTQKGRGMASAELDRRAARRSVRRQIRPSPTLAREAELDAMVADAIARPAARLDCVGAIVAAGHIPQAARR
ncbi:protein DpdE [Phenylobacterium sp.]|uniref:protein DpdE n=1 Tax=Phenylobacterium sp. TaxID=1871053 RepID=UPI003565AEA9